MQGSGVVRVLRVCTYRQSVSRRVGWSCCVTISSIRVVWCRVSQCICSNQEAEGCRGEGALAATHTRVCGRAAPQFCGAPDPLCLPLFSFVQRTSCLSVSRVGGCESCVEQGKEADPWLPACRHETRVCCLAGLQLLAPVRIHHQRLATAAALALMRCREQCLWLSSTGCFVYDCFGDVVCLLGGCGYKQAVPAVAPRASSVTCVRDRLCVRVCAAVACSAAWCRARPYTVSNGFGPAAGGAATR